jgi:hypothetical protein
VQELRQLRSTIAADPIPEKVMVTVFMQGLDYSPVKTEVFRCDPETLEDAIQIALREDHCIRQAKGLPTLPPEQREAQSAQPAPAGQPAASGGPELMELDALDSRRVRVRCYNCQQFGHYKRNCPRLKRQRGKGARSRQGGRGKGANRQGNDGGSAGNAETQ